MKLRCGLFAICILAFGPTNSRATDVECINISPVNEEHCIANDSLTFRATNNCDVIKHVQICIEQRNGHNDCGSSYVSPGMNWDYYTCTQNIHGTHTGGVIP